MYSEIFEEDFLKNYNETKYFVVVAHHFETKVSNVGKVFSCET